jgi:hypothetical protein
MVKKRFACERTVIFAGHALAVVTHWDKGGEFHTVDYIIPTVKNCTFHL